VSSVCSMAEYGKVVVLVVHVISVVYSLVVTPVQNDKMTTQFSRNVASVVFGTVRRPTSFLRSPTDQEYELIA